MSKPNPRRICRRHSSIVVAAFLLAAGLAASGQSSPEKIDLEMTEKIRAEALQHSRLMEMLGYLTDVAGPRLTGSPNIKKAQEYARETLRDWGLASARLEAWGPFGRGWSLEGFTANMTAPAFSPLIAYPKAWSPSTDGTVRGEAVFLNVNSAADLEKYKGKLKGKIVLFEPARRVEPLFEPQAHRQTDEELLRLANAPPPAEPQAFHFTPEQRAAQELSFRKWQLVQSEGAAVVLQPAYRDAGTVYVTAATVPYPPDVPFEQRAHAWDLRKPAILPQAVVAAEHYNRMVRLVTRGIPVQLEVNISARFYDDDPMSYNVIAEIPGTDRKEEVAMIGSSIDSWHAATGATDNAAGAATALEVIRILHLLVPHPRRTIRIGLWSAEEQGSLGSRAYVAAHFGRRIPPPEGSSARARIEPGPEYKALAGYFNLDYGTGRIRGVYLQGNEAVRPIFRAWLGPLQDLDASTLTIANIGATDHVPFDEIGLPGFQFLRDYMEGTNTRAAHTNMDTYEHVLEDDLKQSAAVAACFLYDLAMREERLPRKPPPPR